MWISMELLCTYITALEITTHLSNRRTSVTKSIFSILVPCDVSGFEIHKCTPSRGHSSAPEPQGF